MRTGQRRSVAGGVGGVGAREAPAGREGEEIVGRSQISAGAGWAGPERQPAQAHRGLGPAAGSHRLHGGLTTHVRSVAN